MRAVFFPGIGGGAHAEWPRVGDAVQAAGHPAVFEDPPTGSAGPAQHARYTLARTGGPCT